MQEKNPSLSHACKIRSLSPMRVCVRVIYSQFPVLLFNPAIFFLFSFFHPAIARPEWYIIIIWNNKRDLDAGYLFNSHWTNPIVANTATADDVDVYMRTQTRVYSIIYNKPFRAQSDLINETQQHVDGRTPFVTITGWKTRK